MPVVFRVTVREMLAKLRRTQTKSDYFASSLFYDFCALE
jgi:hypothetical protein